MGLLHDTRVTVSVAGILSVAGLTGIICLILGLIMGAWIG